MHTIETVNGQVCAIFSPRFAPTKLTSLKNTFAEALDSLRIAEMSHQYARDDLWFANKADEHGQCYIPGVRPAMPPRAALKAAAMARINETRCALRDRQARCLKARDALRLWPGVADQVVADYQR